MRILGQQSNLSHPIVEAASIQPRIDAAIGRVFLKLFCRIFQSLNAIIETWQAANDYKIMKNKVSRGNSSQ